MCPEVLNGGGESKYMTGAKLAVQLLGSKKDKAQAGADDKPIVAFRSANLTVLESVGTVEVRVIVKGNLKQDATVKYKTRDATAKKGEDYEEWRALRPTGVCSLGIFSAQARWSANVYVERDVHSPRGKVSWCIFSELFCQRLVRSSPI